MSLRYICYLSCLLSLPAAAQDEMISHKPVSAEREVKARLFELDSAGINYYFRANLPGDNFLVIEFNKASYWPAKGTLTEIFRTAKETTKQVQDSFHNPSASKRIDIHIPIKKEPLTVRLHEYKEHADYLVMDNSGSSPLKLGMDTIRVMRSFSEKMKKDKKKELSQVQYSLILKDLEEINKLAADQVLIQEIEIKFDSLMEWRRSKWSRQDTWHHNLQAIYDPYNTDAKKKLVVDRERGLQKSVEVDAYWGMSIFQNQLVPYADYGISYLWPTKEKDAFRYVKLSTSALIFFEKLSKSEIQTYSSTFINLETGKIYPKRNTRLPVYELATGVGVKINYVGDYPPLQGTTFRWFFRYNVTKNVFIMPEYYTVYQKAPISGTTGLTFLGFTVGLKIL